MVTGTSKGEPKDSPASSRNWIRSRCTSSSGDMVCGTAGSGAGTPPGTAPQPPSPPVNDTRLGGRSRYRGTRRGPRGREKHPTGSPRRMRAGAPQGNPGGGDRRPRNAPAPPPHQRLRAAPTPLPSIHPRRSRSPPSAPRSPIPAHRGHVPARTTCAGSGRSAAAGAVRRAAAPWRPAVRAAMRPRNPGFEAAPGHFPWWRQWWFLSYF